MATRTFFDDCQLGIESDVEGANKAYDYLTGCQLPHLKTLLSSERGIKKWEERGVLPQWEAFVPLIIERSANTYQDTPNREVLTDGGDLDENKSQIYNDILKTSGFTSQENAFDEICRLFGVGLVLVQYENETEEIITNILSRNICDIKWNAATRTIDELIYTAGVCGVNGGQIFHIWTPKVVKTLEKGGDKDVETEEPHPYGIVPVAFRYDTGPPAYQFWPSAKWDQLVYVNDAINLFQTQTKYAQTYQTFPTWFTDSDLPDDTVIGPDVLVKLTAPNQDAPPYIESKSATSVKDSLDGFVSWLQGYKTDIAEQWGVNLKTGGEGSADSGFKLVVEEFPSLELRNKRINTAIPFEEQLHNIINIVSNAHNLDSVDGDFRVSFKPPRLPVNDKEQWEIAMGKLSMKVWDVVDYWKYENPDITPEQIAEKQDRIQKGLLGEAKGILPPFNNVAPADG